MAEGRVLEGVEIDASAPVRTCRSCGALVWWGTTANGKRNPFDVELGPEGQTVRTAVTHFSTCNDPKRWSKR